MLIRSIVVGQVATNCYLVFNKKNECLIVDPGDDADYIVRVISDLELRPIAILATHAHFDHIMAVNELKLAYNIPFYLNKKDEKLLKWARKSSIRFANLDPGPSPKVDKYLKNGECQVPNIKCQVIETPGHSPGSVSLYFKKEKVVFVGDLIFEGGGVGRFDFPYCDEKLLQKSIDTVLRLPDDTRVFSGHGNPTTIEEFKRSSNSSPPAI